MTMRALLLLALIASGLALAQSGGEFELIGAEPAAGGGQMAGGTFTATVTIGQAGAAAQASSGGSWTMNSGLWAVQENLADEPASLIFASGFED